jgi:hypothetical protein
MLTDAAEGLRRPQPRLAHARHLAGEKPEHRHDKRRPPRLGDNDDGQQQEVRTAVDVSGRIIAENQQVDPEQVEVSEGDQITERIKNCADPGQRAGQPGDRRTQRPHAGKQRSGSRDGYRAGGIGHGAFGCWPNQPAATRRRQCAGVLLELRTR